jgi:hypothetical protein
MAEGKRAPPIDKIDEDDESREDLAEDWEEASGSPAKIPFTVETSGLHVKPLSLGKSYVSFKCFKLNHYYSLKMEQ